MVRGVHLLRGALVGHPNLRLEHVLDQGQLGGRAVSTVMIVVLPPRFNPDLCLGDIDKRLDVQAHVTEVSVAGRDIPGHPCRFHAARSPTRIRAHARTAEHAGHERSAMIDCNRPGPRSRPFPC